MNKDEIAGPEVFSRAIVHLQKELQKALDDATTLSAENEKLRRALRDIAGGSNMVGFADAMLQGNASSAVSILQSRALQALAGDDHGHR